MPKAAYMTAKNRGITAITKPRTIRDFNDKIFLNFIFLEKELDRDHSIGKSGILKIYINFKPYKIDKDSVEVLREVREGRIQQFFLSLENAKISG